MLQYLHILAKLKYLEVPNVFCKLQKMGSLKVFYVPWANSLNSVQNLQAIYVILTWNPDLSHSPQQMSAHVSCC